MDGGSGSRARILFGRKGKRKTAEYRRELNTAALFSAGHRSADRRKIAMLTDNYVHAYVCMRQRVTDSVNNVCARLYALGRAMLARRDKYKV